MKKIFSIALVALLAMPLLAINHLPARSFAMPELQKKACVRNISRVLHAPQASMDRAFSASYVEAAYWGSYTGDPSDWTFFFADNSNNILIYADVYDKGDETHIDGTYSFSDGSIGEAYVVRAAGDTVNVTGGSIVVLHNTATNYHFTVALTAGNETFTLSQDLDVDAYDYLFYYYGYDSDIYLEDAGENPGGDPTADADYTYEPTDTTTLNVTMNAIEVDTDYFEEDGDIDIYLYSINAQGDTTAVAAFYVYAPQMDPATYVPAGTYVFAADPTVGNVEASAGMINYYGQYYPTPAYYAMLDNEGYILSIYYLVDGQLTLTGNADGSFSILVNAISGNGSTVNITYGAAAPGSALNNVSTAETCKFLRDGQVLIRKNGRVYNAFGQTVE